MDLYGIATTRSHRQPVRIIKLELTMSSQNQRAFDEIVEKEGSKGFFHYSLGETQANDVPKQRNEFK